MAWVNFVVTSARESSKDSSNQSRRKKMKKEKVEETIPIRGMHCKSCANLIESKVKSLKGIEKIKVSLNENKAFVRFNPNEIDSDKIKSEIETLGYSTDEEKKSEVKSRNILQGVTYGLIPHIGCIAFIIGSVFGVTLLMQYFKPLLMNPYFFHILVLISLGFATLSSAVYLKRNGFLSSAGVKKKWKYLSTMYGSTIGINMLLFLVVFPLLANATISSSATGSFVSVSGSTSSIKLQVNIPCSGHAPLITQELKTINGVEDVKFNLPNIFDVKYDSAKTSKSQILSLDVFKTYKATVIDEAANQQLNSQITSQPVGGSCCGSGSCGGSSGGCGCGRVN